MEFFEVYKYQVITKFLEPAIFPEYKGSTLRGAFGLTFKDIICVNKKILIVKNALFILNVFIN
ncbi:MAG: hypothetical protein NC827_08405 [Candidatus Omnitrophica bacterium]|nr:hypothetical protein [Candidatus Omnitrophota bacterium]MCM8803311.1 hypothetical protein [Candidatus Omnitrophota bacterium]